VRVPALAFATTVLAMSGCDLQPPPKKQPPTAQRPTTTPPPNAGSGSAQKPVIITPANEPKKIPDARPPGPPPGAGTGSAGSAEAPKGAAMTCLEIGTHFADIYVRTAKDAAEKATLEQERSLLVRSVSERCTQATWSDEVRTCFGKAANRDDITKCTTLVRPRPGANPATP
jgi:hypothetical protein